MPTFKIRVVNEEFSASEVQTAGDLERASAEALRGALLIGTDEVAGGKPFFGAEIQIDDDDGRTVKRFLVCLGTTPLRTH